MRGRAVRPRGKAATTREGAHLGRNPGEGQRCVQSPAYASRSEEALGRLEETQRRPASGCSPSQLLCAVRPRGLDAWTSLPDKPEASVDQAKAKHQTKAELLVLS